jgi:hypothetical protein
MLIAPAVLVTCLTFLQNPASTKQQVPEHLAYPKGFKAKPGVPYWNLSIPTPMLSTEWEAYGRMLRLSPEQHRALGSVYDEYRRSDWAFRLEHVQPLYDRSGEIAGQGMNHVDPDVAAQRVALYQARNKVLPGISRVERTFFEAVGGFLGDSQLEMLEIVRLMRERANDRRFDSTFPGFSFDSTSRSFHLPMRASM